MADMVPGRLTAGDDWSWRVFAPGPPAELRVRIAPEAGGGAIAASAAWSGAHWTVTVAAAMTAGLAPGVYLWSAVTESSAGERTTLGRGRIEVLADPEAAPEDRRSRAARTLEAIEATIEGRAVKDAESYTIEGRSISRTPIEALLRLRSVYRRQVRAERGGSPIQMRRVTH